MSILDQANLFKSEDKIKFSEIINMLGISKLSDLYNLSKNILENDLNSLITTLEDMSRSIFFSKIFSK